ncbi:hypothetical protein [Psychroserpens luteus]|uniref:Uncharacterized protein n=1 Tax=Psychroserpens luteus TaxID=1434066 RepID=A0ABW5ZR57_9FLAO|nr:hypothetical protein [Psychroserpens luteus]
MLTDKKVNRFLIPILAIVIIYSIFKQIRTDKNENQLESENNYVIGEIIDHRISGIAENYYVEYKYFVNGIKYVKSEFYADKFRDCHQTKKCIGLEYIVFYESKKPENAFMDFDLTELDMKKKNVKLKNIKEQLEKYKTE